MTISYSNIYRLARCALSKLFPLLSDPTTAFLSQKKEVRKMIDEGRAEDGVDTDFSKAFDKGPHGGLLVKIKMRGIHGDLAVWIQNYSEISYR